MIQKQYSVSGELRELLADNAGEAMPAKGEFFYYFGLGQVNRAMPFQDSAWKGYGKGGDEFCRRMFILANDFDSIVTILHKIAWLTSQWQSGMLSVLPHPKSLP